MEGQENYTTNEQYQRGAKAADLANRHGLSCQQAFRAADLLHGGLDEETAIKKAREEFPGESRKTDESKPLRGVVHVGRLGLPANWRERGMKVVDARTDTLAFVRSHVMRARRLRQTPAIQRACGQGRARKSVIARVHAHAGAGSASGDVSSGDGGGDCSGDPDLPEPRARAHYSLHKSTQNSLFVNVLNLTFLFWRSGVAL